MLRLSRTTHTPHGRRAFALTPSLLKKKKPVHNTRPQKPSGDKERQQVVAEMSEAEAVERERDKREFARYMNMVRESNADAKFSRMGFKVASGGAFYMSSEASPEFLEMDRNRTDEDEAPVPSPNFPSPSWLLSPSRPALRTAAHLALRRFLEEMGGEACREGQGLAEGDLLDYSPAEVRELVAEHHSQRLRERGQGQVGADADLERLDVEEEAEDDSEPDFRAAERFNPELAGLTETMTEGLWEEGEEGLGNREAQLARLVERLGVLASLQERWAEVSSKETARITKEAKAAEAQVKRSRGGKMRKEEVVAASFEELQEQHSDATYRTMVESLQLKEEDYKEAKGGSLATHILSAAQPLQDFLGNADVLQGLGLDAATAERLAETVKKMPRS